MRGTFWFYLGKGPPTSSQFACQKASKDRKYQQLFAPNHFLKPFWLNKVYIKYKLHSEGDIKLKNLHVDAV